MKTPTRFVLEQVAACVRDGAALVNVADPNWQIHWFNPAFAAVSAMSAGALANQSARDLVRRLGGATALDAITAAIAAGDSGTVTLMPPPNASNAAVPLVLSVQTILNKDETRSSDYLFLLRARDAREALTEAQDLRTELAEARQQLRAISDDPVTGIASREHFLNVLERDRAVAKREGYSLTLLAFRMDAYSQYHETFGDHACDSCMRMLVRTITRRLRRGGDFAGRADKETVVVLMNGGDASAAGQFADMIAKDVDALRIHHPKSPHGRYVSVRRTCRAFEPADTSSAMDVFEALLADLAPVEEQTASFLSVDAP